MRRATTITCLGVVLVGLALRLWIFPSPHVFRDIDERGYLHGGPLVLDGLPPGYQAAPAGPLTWTGWAYAGIKAAKNLLLPGPEERGVPLTVRPFIAVDHALFDVYHDISGLHRFVVIVFLIVAVAAIAAAYGLGHHYGGWIAGLLVGGLAAVLPMFVDYAVQSRPYGAAWSFAWIAMYFAAASRRRRAWLLAAVFFGLAVASRIDVAVLLPLTYWFLWDTRTARRPAPFLAFTVVAVGITFLVAPWWLTGLIGNLRAIATIQFLGAPAGTDSPRQTLKVIGWYQGLAPALLLLLAATPVVGVVTHRAGRLGKALLAAYLVVLTATVFKSTGFGLHHKAAVLVGLVAASSLVIGAVVRRWPGLALSAVILAIVLPLVQTVRQGRAILAQDAPDQATAWVNVHVRPESTLYLTASSLAAEFPLPTAKASSGIWREITDESAANRKFESGLKRLASDTSFSPPRALGELNLVQERGNHRSWFILGGRPSLGLPRFNIRLVRNSPLFGVQDLQAALAEQPGVVVWRGRGEGPPAWLGSPVARWTNSAGDTGTWIFCPPAARGDLIEIP